MIASRAPRARVGAPRQRDRLQMSASRTEVLTGVSLSLSGRFERQGREAQDGVRLWAEHVERAGGLPIGLRGSRRPLRLIALDDGSIPARARDNIGRLL